jgi:predicted metal-dependent hydrolase
MAKPAKIDNQINYNVAYRDVKHPRLEYKTGTLFLILPKNDPNQKQILQKHQKWIHQKEQAIQNALKEAKTKTLNNLAEKDLKTLVTSLVQTYQKELHTKINKIYFRRMKTKWASHSRNHNLTVNTLLKHLPQNLIDYIIYHETAHALERKHNERYWKIVQRKFRDPKRMESDLMIYWFLIKSGEQPLSVGKKGKKTH